MTRCAGRLTPAARVEVATRTLKPNDNKGVHTGVRHVGNRGCKKQQCKKQQRSVIAMKKRVMNGDVGGAQLRRPNTVKREICCVYECRCHSGDKSIELTLTVTLCVHQRSRWCYLSRRATCQSFELQFLHLIDPSRNACSRTARSSTTSPE